MGPLRKGGRHLLLGLAVVGWWATYPAEPVELLEEAPRSRALGYPLLQPLL